MADACRFCAIVAGDEPADVVVETDVALGFLDHRPVFKGHTLVVPRDHLETLGDVEAELLEPFFTVVQRVARAVVGALDAHGSFVAMNNVVSQAVPHLHVHVVPRRRKDGLRGFFWPREKYESDAERADYASRLRDALDGSA